MTCGASLRLFKPLVEFVLLLLAILCGLSRISDYKHHWSDVFAGLVLGTFFSVLLRVESFRTGSCQHDRARM